MIDEWKSKTVSAKGKAENNGILSKPENVIKTCYKYFTDNNLGIKNYVRIKYLELQCSKYKGWSLVNEHTKMLHDQFKLSMADL